MISLSFLGDSVRLAIVLAFVPISQAYTADKEMANLGVRAGMKLEMIGQRPDLVLNREVSSQKGRLKAIHVYKRDVGPQGIIILEDDNIVRFIPGQMVSYCWSPDGKSLAYLRGKYIGHRMFGDTIGIYHADSGRHEMVISNPAPQYLQGINWAEFDRNIHVYNVASEDPVYRVDLEAQELVLTEFQGIMFSPDGRYHYHKSVEGTFLELYRSDPVELIWRYEVGTDIDYEKPHPLGNWINVLGWHIDQNNDTYFYVTDLQRSPGANVGIVNCQTGKFRVLRNPREDATPVFSDGKVRWK